VKIMKPFFGRVSTYREGNIICWRWKIQLEYPCHNNDSCNIMCSIATLNTFVSWCFRHVNLSKVC
jgi:hypothetical protein